MSNSRLERYLDVMERSLSFQSVETRQDWREEARLHLQEIAAACEEAGLSPEKAMEEALRRFGSPERIGRQMAQHPIDAVLDGRTAVALFSAPLMVVMVLMIGLANAYVSTDSEILLGWLRFGGVSAFFLIPIIGGWRIGRRLRYLQTTGPVLRVLAFVGILFIPIAAMFLNPVLASIMGGKGLDMRSGLLWFPITWLSVLLTHRWQTRHYRLSQ